jgi:hypothetical protein
METKKYSSDLIKGTGLITETMTLLALYNGQSKNDFLSSILENNILSTSSERRAKDIVNSFFRRYINPNPQIAICLKSIREKGYPLKQIKQILLLHTARVSPVLYDFIVDEFSSYKKKGYSSMPTDGPLQFIRRIKEENELNWNDENCKRISYGLHKSLIDFELISAHNEIMFYSIDSFTFLYLLFDLHFRGFSDADVWNSKDWQLFNLNKTDVIEMIKDYSLKNGYVAQTTGDLLAITWTYKSMEELIDATL